MVNYCCVHGCGRNSKLSSHLNYYSLPKERHRQIQWMKAGGREDLLEKSHLKPTYRFCSRHFAPSSIRNRSLGPDAMPTLCLPGSNEEEATKNEPVQHHDIVCNSCNNTILGFRYKCVTCADYDLCPKCEMLETHSHHYVLRIPRPMKFVIADDLITKWRDFFKAEHVNPDCIESADDFCDTSDDEPITKYVKQYDSGIDLTEDVKETIQREITRVLSLKEKDKSKKQTKSGKKKKETNAMKRKNPDEMAKPTKKQKLSESTSTQNEDSVPNTSVVEVPEVAFADVNQLGDSTDVKYEMPVTVEETEFVQPFMHVKLSDDLRELMIEMTQNGEKTVFKYTD